MYSLCEFVPQSRFTNNSKYTTKVVLLFKIQSHLHVKLAKNIVILLRNVIWVLSKANLTWVRHSVLPLKLLHQTLGVNIPEALAFGLYYVSKIFLKTDLIFWTLCKTLFCKYLWNSNSKEAFNLVIVADLSVSWRLKWFYDCKLSVFLSCKWYSLC